MTKTMQLGWFLSVALLVSTGSAHGGPYNPGFPHHWSAARAPDPIVPTAWLRENASRSNLVIVDVRSEADYRLGHIPKALSAPFDAKASAWSVSGNLVLELPTQAALFSTIGSLGIAPGSWVVVVSGPNPQIPSYGFAAATRVAATLIYAGVRHVSVLDGGFHQWVTDGGPTTTDVPSVTPVAYSARVDASMFVSTEYVKEHIGRAAIIDARDAAVYYGVIQEDYAPKPGHIPTAKSLPTPWLWSSDGVYKDVSVLGKMVDGVVGWNKMREIIVYCGVGGYASSAWFVLTQVLGYPNVKFYDGSAQSWVQNENMVPYRWD